MHGAFCTKLGKEQAKSDLLEADLKHAKSGRALSTTSHNGLSLAANVGR
jgi:hypothetical protein